MFCPQCGTQVTPGQQRFCQECGAEVGRDPDQRGRQAAQRPAGHARRASGLPRCALSNQVMERDTTMRTLLILASIICFSAPAFAQTAAPKVGGKPLKQVKPLAPMAASSSEQSRGPSFGPATVRPRQNFAVQRPRPRPHQRPNGILPPQTNNRRSNSA